MRNIDQKSANPLAKKKFSVSLDINRLIATPSRPFLTSNSAKKNLHISICVCEMKIKRKIIINTTRGDDNT